MEVFCELQTACDLGYMTAERFDEMRLQSTDIAKMLSGLRASLERKLNDHSASSSDQGFNNH